MVGQKGAIILLLKLNRKMHIILLLLRAMGISPRKVPM